MPPCEADDLPYRKRIDQLNVQLIGKVTTVAQQILWAQKEIDQWKESWRTAKEWKRTFEQIYGRLTANPLPSMVTAYNRRAPLGQYLKLSANGDWTVSLEVTDFREITKQFMDGLEDQVQINTMYFRGLPKEVTNDIKQDSKWFQSSMSKRVSQIADKEKYFQQVSDSLKASGDSIASRYVDWADNGGLSEAKISRLSAYLSRMRGTSVSAEAAALRAREQAVRSSVRRGERLRDLQRDMNHPKF